MSSSNMGWTGQRRYSAPAPAVHRGDDVSQILTQRVEEWLRWTAWNSGPGATLRERMDYAQKVLRGLLGTAMGMLDETEALAGRGKWPMATELVKKINDSVGEFLKIRGQPFGDLDRKVEFLLDMLKQVMDLQLILAKELEATQQGRQAGRIITLHDLPGRVM